MGGHLLRLGSMTSIITSVGFNSSLRTGADVDHVAELTAYLQIQRYGLPVDTDTQVMLKRKAEAYFRDYDLPYTQQVEILCQALSKILDTSPLQKKTAEWLSNKKQYDIVAQNHTVKGAKVKRPPLLKRLWWAFVSCGSQKYQSKNIRKWQVANPVQVLPKST
jgi:hypothetical protein